MDSYYQLHKFDEVSAFIPEERAALLLCQCLAVTGDLVKIKRPGVELESLHFQPVLRNGCCCLCPDCTWSSKAERCSIKRSVEINVTTFQWQDSGVSILCKPPDAEPDGLLIPRRPSEEFILRDSLSLSPYCCRERRRCMRFLANLHL